MRITDEQREYIVNSFLEVFDDAKLYLFGSRVDDEKRGGDIDLLIKLNIKLSEEERFKKVKEFRKKLYRLPFYKIDIITLSKDENLKPIHKSALKDGIALFI